jgi:hypothetical protein
MKSQMREKALFFVTLFLAGQLTAEAKDPFAFTYVYGKYSCTRAGKVSYVYVFSQTFGACFSDNTDHVKIATQQSRNADQAAESKCSGGTVTLDGSFANGSFTYTGPTAESYVNKGRDDQIRTKAQMRDVQVESFYVSTPYSGKCQ